MIKMAANLNGGVWPGQARVRSHLGSALLKHYLPSYNDPKSVPCCACDKYKDFVINPENCRVLVLQGPINVSFKHL